MQPAEAGAVSRHHYARYNHCHDARSVKDVRQQVAAVRDHQGREDLERRVLCEPQQRQSRKADRQPDRGTDDRELEEAEAGVDDRRRATNDRAKHGAEGGDPGAVVEQALAFEECAQPAGCFDAAKQGDHRDGVGGREDGAQQHAVRP